MRILAMETSGKYGGVALSEGERVIEEVRLSEGLRHGRDLILAARDACTRAGWTPRGIEAVAVSIGPGSFTGVRIAVVVAKVMARDAGAGIVAVPTLRVLAENAPPAARVAPILDAKRGGLYAGTFAREGRDWTRESGPLLIEPAALAARLAPETVVLGRGLAKARAALEAFPIAPEATWDPRAAVVARLGARMAAAGEFANPLTLEPIYIRRPEAEEIWERREAEK